MRAKKYAILVLMIAAVVPYLVASFYCMPFADDFCFGWTAAQNISFLSKIANQYLYWNGRYTTDVLVNLHPLAFNSLQAYQLSSFFAITITPLVFFALIKNFLTTLNALLAGGMVSLYYLSVMPNVTEGVYWFIGIVNYHLAALCFILQLVVMLNTIQGKGSRSILLSVTLLIISIGFNEVAAVIIPAYYFAGWVFLRITGKEKRLQKLMLLHFMVAFIASAAVICSPGNFVRAGIFTQGFNIGYSLVMASAQTVRFIGTWCFNIPFIVMIALSIAFADKVKLSVINGVGYQLWLLLLLFTVFMASFLPYMSTGILGQHRTLNYVMPFFVLLSLATAVSISAQCNLYRYRSLKSNSVLWFLAIVAVFSTPLLANGQAIITDFASNSFSAYKNDFLMRQRNIIEHPTSTIPALKKVPTAFTIVDAGKAPWVETCMHNYYNNGGRL